MADGQRPPGLAPTILVRGPGDVEDLVVDRQGDARPRTEPPVVAQGLGEGSGDDGATTGSFQVAPQCPIPPSVHAAVRRAGAVLGDGQAGPPVLGGVAADVDAGEHRVRVDDVGSRLSPAVTGRPGQAADRLLVEPHRTSRHGASRYPVPGQGPLGDCGHRAPHDDDPVLDIRRQLTARLPQGDRFQGDDTHSHPAALKHARLVAEEGPVVGAVPVRVPRGSQDDVHLTPPHREERSCGWRARTRRRPRSAPHWPPTPEGGRRSPVQRRRP